MTTIDTKLRILWLSDIHYDKNYTEKNKSFKKHISSFLIYCSKLKNIDYILISGDIAQSGLIEEYDLFFNDILDPLLLLPNLKNTKLLVIPGNHDVNREVNPFFKTFIREITKTDFKRDAFLTEKINSFEKSFSQYSKSFSKYKDKVPDNFFGSYKDNFLNGYFIDHSKKIIFVLLNSAWYSFGDKFIDKYFEEFLKYDASNKTFESTKTELQIKKEIHKIAEEYGSQVVNMDVFDRYNNLKQDIEMYNDYIIIQTLHHPFNWLDWNERINYSTTDNKFTTLKKHTDLVLTGHEHVPRHHNPDYLNDKSLLHIPAGCFMDKQKPKDYEIKNNWFSVLNINTKKRTVLQQKVMYSIDSNKWFSKSSEIKELNKKHKSSLDSSRKEGLKDEFELLYDEGRIVELLTNNKGVIKVDDKPLYINNENLYVFLKINFDLIDTKVLISTLTKYKSIEIVQFIFVDLLVDENDDYSKGKDKLEVLNSIKERMDFSFDKYRHKFFSTLSIENIENFKEVKFVLKLIPFWEIETFIYSNK